MGGLFQWCTVDGESALAQPLPVVQLFARITQALRERMALEARRSRDG